MSVFQAAPDAGGGSGRSSAIHIARAEELLGTLPGVVSVRIEASPLGDVDAIHVLTSVEIGPKQTVRNIESALLAHLGMRVDHRKISVATTVDAPRIRLAPSAVEHVAGFDPQPPSAPLAAVTPPLAASGSLGAAPQLTSTPAESTVVRPLHPTSAVQPTALPESAGSRRYVFDDVEVKRSRNGLSCRVTLRRGDESFEGEAEGLETETARLELSARATVLALAFAEGRAGTLALAGVQRVDAFHGEFAFVGVSARQGRESVLLSGSCAIRESAEVSGALAVLDATNRWLEVSR